MAPLATEAQAPTTESLLPITTFSVGDGLPSALVFQLVPDRNGRIWILNRDGVVSYDGATFEPQGVQQGLLATQCAGLAIDDEGRVLAVAFDGRIFRNEAGAWRALNRGIDRPFAGQAL